MKQTLRLGIVGCGAITETGHLPACQLTPGIHLTALADIALERARAFAGQYHIEQAVADYREIVTQVDAVILATPPHLHLEQARFFIEQGVHVLCEKPLANTFAECQELVELTQRYAPTKLAVGHVRRFFFYAQKIKALIDQDELGKVLKIRADEGYPYGWPAYTGHAFQRETSPGGVMFDLGIHLLDLFLWLGGEAAGLRYADDAIGGVESNAAAEITFASGAVGQIHISRTCERPNLFSIEGERGMAQAGVYIPGRVMIKIGSQKSRKTLQTSQGLVDALAAQLEDFVQAIQNDRAPLVDASQGLASIHLVEDGYKQARQRGLPSKAPIPGVVRWS